MLPQAARDVDALQMGFMADGVLRAMRLAQHGSLDERHATRLREGAMVLREVAAGVGAAPTQAYPVAGLSSFSYAAEALRAVGTGKLGEGLRAHFAGMASNLEQIAAGSEVDPVEWEEVRAFFRALSNATLESWGVTQTPGPLSAESAPWTES